MNWKAFFSTPPPDTVWSIDAQTVVAVHRDRKQGYRCVAVDAPEGLLELGPAGLHGVDVQRLTALVTKLQETIKGDRRAAIIVPTHWVRCFLLEAEDLPRRKADLQDVLRWRLKKLLPIAPTELRIAASIQNPIGTTQRVLCSAVSEKALALLESAFAGAGISPGLILPRIFALATEPAPPDVRRVIVQQEPSVFSMAVVADGGIRLIKTKPLPATGGPWTGGEREMNLAMSYIRTTMEIEGEIEVVVNSWDEGSSQSMVQWLEGQTNVVVRVSEASRICPDVNLSATLGNGRLAPIAAVLVGGMP